jgi:hypothetical protein
MALRTAAARPTRRVPINNSFPESDTRYMDESGAASETPVRIIGAATVVAATGVTVV